MKIKEFYIEAENIQKTLEFVKSNIKDGMETDIVIYFREGNYYLTESLIFDDSISGKNGHKVIVKNYNNEKVIVNGGIKVGNWELFKDDIYKAKLPKGYEFSTLYVNGERATLARYPKKIKDAVPRGKYLLGDFTVYENRKLNMGFKNEEIPYISNIKDLKIYLWPGEDDGRNWYQNSLAITNIDYNKNIISWNEESTYGAGKGSRYYIEGALELLTECGEYYYDTEKSILYYKLKEDEDINNIEVICPLVDSVFCFQGDATNNVHDITIEGIIIRNSNLPYTYKEFINGKGIVYLENAENVEIKNCEIYNSGWHGVHLYGKVKNNRIIGNYIHNIGHTGIQLEDLPRGGLGPYRNMGAHIENNRIYRCGEIVGHASCMELVDSGDNYIAYNRMEIAPRYGLGMSSMFSGRIIGKKAYDGRLVTKDNATDYQHSRNNIIEYNDMMDVNQDSQDTGVLETWCPGTENVFNANLIHDSNIYFSFGNGLYLDDNANEMKITNNVIYDLQKTGDGKLNTVMVAKGINDIIQNNILADNNVAEGGGGIGSLDLGLKRENHSQIVKQNIILNCGHNAHYFSNWDDDRYKYCNKNVYCGEKPIGVNGAKGILEFMTMNEWRTLFNEKFDQNTIVEDPNFVCSKDRDYRLKYNSKAYLLGFKDIDFEKMGLKGHFKYKEQDKISKLFAKTNEEPLKSFVRLNSGDSIDLIVTARTKKGFCIDNLKGYCVKFQNSNEEIAFVNNEGKVFAKSKGVCTITTFIVQEEEEINTCYDILVDDESKEIEGLIPYSILAVGEEIEICAALKSEFGVYLKNNIQIKSSKEDIIEIKNDGIIKAVNEGNTEIYLIASDKDKTFEKIINIEVVKEKLSYIEVEMKSSIIKIGESSDIKVIGVLNSGFKREVNSSEYSIKTPDFIKIRDGKITGLKEDEGEIKISVSINGVIREKKIKIIVVEDKILPQGWIVSNYKDCEGLALFKDEKLLMISNGENVWFKEDDVTYLNKSMDFENFSKIECSIKYVKETSPNAQIGLMIRKEDIYDSACIHFRVDSKGNSMIAYRNEKGKRIECMNGIKGSLPCKLRIERENDCFKFFYKEDSIAIGKSKPWINIGNIKMDFEDKFLVGVALFSNNKTYPTTGIVENLIIE